MALGSNTCIGIILSPPNGFSDVVAGGHDDGGGDGKVGGEKMSWPNMFGSG